MSILKPGRFSYKITLGAYTVASYQEGALPVYRFYSDNLIVHLLTTDENEKNFLINTTGDVWRYEGIAFHAYP
ncbi:hypothetical protein QUF75_09220 [Desulfococcaceae bacterium HSG7]|nr:hypothetical protein [Desulfococcaceae bacterium HSG7]